MKLFYILVSVIFVFTTTGNSQSMFQKGDMWYMSLHTDYSSLLKSKVYRVASDSLVGKTLYHTIEYTDDTTSSEWKMFPHFFRQSDDTVFVLNNDKEYVYFNFAWMVDDTFDFQVSELSDCYGTVSREVQDTFSNGDSMRSLVFYLEESNVLINKLGLFKDMFHLAGHCEIHDDFELLTCFYRNGELIYKPEANKNIPCYYGKTTSTVDYSSPELKIWPTNITKNEQINVQFEGGYGSLYYVNPFGQVEYVTEVEPGEELVIDVSSVGLNILMVRMSGEIVCKKFIVYH